MQAISPANRGLCPSFCLLEIKLKNSNFPGGFANGVTVRGVPILNSYPGNIFWVDSGSGSDGNKGTFDRPFSTLDYAIGRCTANNGDIIFLKAGHAETVASASAITADVAGVSIVGLGTGSDRPTFTFSATGSTIVISAASVGIENIITTPSIDSVVSPIVVQAADVYLDIEHRDASATVEAVRAVLTTAAANRLTAKIKYIGDTGGNAVVNAIRLVGVDTGDIEVDFYGVASTSVVEFITTACTNIKVKGTIYNSGTTDGSKTVVDTAGSSTWSAEVFDATAGAPFSGGSGSTLAKDDLSAVTDALYGANGIATYPPGAAAANNVSLAEVARYIQDQVINGTGTVLPSNTSLYGVLAGATGIPSFPAAAAPANDVSIAEVLRDTWDSLRNGTGGSEPGTNKSIVDAIGFDGAAAVTATAGMLRTAAGTSFVVKKTLTSSAVVQAGVDITAVSTVGDILIEDIVFQTNATGLAAGTNFTVESNNTSGVAVFFSETVANLGANKTESLGTGSVTAGDAFVLETGKKLIAKCTVADCTGAGTVDVYIICRRLADNATLTAA